MTDSTTSRTFRVWCLSWDEEESAGHDVVPYDILEGFPREQRGILHVPDWTLREASDAAEAYADYAHDNRDGYECTWPLTFRVRSADGTTEDFEVERDFVTEFSAAPVRAKEGVA